MATIKDSGASRQAPGSLSRRGQAILVLIALPLIATGGCFGRWAKTPPGVSVPDCITRSCYEDSALGQQTTQDYDRQTLFNFIDGEADLFLECNFQQLRVVDARTAQGGTVSIQVYSMASPFDAFALFSARNSDVNRANAAGTECADDGTCLEFCHGAYFVKVCRDTFLARVRLGRGVDRCISQEPRTKGTKKEPTPVDFLPLDSLLACSPVPYSISIAEGPLSLRLLAYPVEGFPGMIGEWRKVYTFRADGVVHPKSEVKGDKVYLDAVSKKGQFDVVMIEYADADSALKAVKAIKASLERQEGVQLRGSRTRFFCIGSRRPTWLVECAGRLVIWNKFLRESEPQGLREARLQK